MGEKWFAVEVQRNVSKRRARLGKIAARPGQTAGFAFTRLLWQAIQPAIDRVAAELNLPTLRFNFRGVGESARHDYGQGEQEDVLSVLALRAQYLGLGKVLAGLSLVRHGLFGGVREPRTHCAAAVWSAPASAPLRRPAQLPFNFDTRIYYGD